MSAHWSEGMDPGFAEMVDVLRGEGGSIRLVYVFGQGKCVQVYRNTRKVGPVIIPARGNGQTTGDVLKMLGDAVEKTIRPRRGDLEAATHVHEPVPSGEFVGDSVEICDLCGLSFRNTIAHPVGAQC